MVKQARKDPCHLVRDERQYTIWHLVKVLHGKIKQRKGSEKTGIGSSMKINGMC